MHEKVWSAVSHPLRNSQAYRLAHPEPKSQGRGQGQGQAPGHASSAGHSSHSSHSSGHGESRGHNSASSPHRPGQGGHQRSSEKGHADSLVEDFTKPRWEVLSASRVLRGFVWRPRARMTEGPCIPCMGCHQSLCLPAAPYPMPGVRTHTHTCVRQAGGPGCDQAAQAPAAAGRGGAGLCGGGAGQGPHVDAAAQAGARGKVGTGGRRAGCLAGAL